MAAARLACYLEGGCPPGGSRVNPGARDRTLPARSEPVDLPGTTYFAGESPQWGGGVAFYDHDEPGPDGGPCASSSLPGSWRTSRRRRCTACPPPVTLSEELVLGPCRCRHSLGPGRYETLVRVGDLDGAPLLTFTSPHGARAVEHTRPAPAYLSMMATGLRESREWSNADVKAYLDTLITG